MDLSIFNITGIRAKMVDKPRGQRVHAYLSWGEMDVLTAEQKIEILEIVKEDTEKLIEFLSEDIKLSLPSA